MCASILAAVLLAPSVEASTRLEQDPSSRELLRTALAVRLAAIECRLMVQPLHPEHIIVEDMELGAALSGEAEFFLDATRGHWRTITDIADIGRTDVIVTDGRRVDAVSTLTEVGVSGDIPVGVHPTSTMMLPNPLLLCVLHLLPLSDAVEGTQPTWGELHGVTPPAGVDWTEETNVGALGLPDLPSVRVLRGEFPGGEIDGQQMQYRVWRLEGTNRPVRTELFQVDAPPTTRIDFTYPDEAADWPRFIVVTEYDGRSEACILSIEVTAVSVNDPSALPTDVWMQDFSKCPVVRDLANGELWVAP